MTVPSFSETDRRIAGVQRVGWIVGGIGTVLSIVGLLVDRERFFASYVFAFIVVFNVTLGSIAVIMLHHMTSGKWGFSIQRFAEASARSLPLVAVLFLPVIAGMGSLYPWMKQGAEATAVASKSAYLNQSFFIVRAVGYFAVWILFAFLLTRWSRLQDATGEPQYNAKLRKLSAPGLIVYALTVTFASVDWVMSLEPGWFSSLYGAIFMVGQGLSALCVGAIALHFFSKSKPLSDIVSPNIFHDIGNLILAFVVLWAYTAFSQFLITWAGNLPEEIPWYVRRLGTEWRMMGLVLIVFHFFVPFFLLLLRRSKRVSSNLWKIAAWILVMRVLDIYWLVMPAIHPEGIAVHWTDLAALLSTGGLWIGFTARNLKSAAIFPARDPRFAILPEPAAEASHG